MQRAEKVGLGVAIVGHAVLFGLLSVGFLATPNPVELKPNPIDVSFAEDVAATQTSPNVSEAPAISEAPDIGPPEDAAPSEPAPPEPAPPEPAPPEPAPAPPAPRAQPRPAPPRPAPAPRPAPKAPPRKATPPAEPKAQPKAEPRAQPKAAPKAQPKAQPKAATPARPAPAPAQTRGQGSNAAAKTDRPRGGRLGDNFLKGVVDTPARGKAEAPRGQAVGAQQIAGLASAIQRQVQPCANRITNPGPGANQIRSRIRLQMRPNGSFAARPVLLGQTGVDGDNERYAQRVGELAIAAMIQCAPYELPDELYEGGWKDIIINYKLPG